MKHFLLKRVWAAKLLTHGLTAYLAVGVYIGFKVTLLAQAAGHDAAFIARAWVLILTSWPRFL